jgi:hypothetical protein
MSFSDVQKPSFTVNGLSASHFEIGGDKRISRHLSGSVPLGAQVLTVIAASRTRL